MSDTPTELPSGTHERSTFGPDHDIGLDRKRLLTQHIRIREYMLPLKWQTLEEISAALGLPFPADISAQLRHLRKVRFGAYVVVKRRRGNPGAGVWEYRVEHPNVFEELDRLREWYAWACAAKP